MGQTDVRSLFEAALRKAGVTVVQVGDDYEVRRGDDTLLVNIENVARQFRRDRDPSVFDDFVQKVIGGQPASVIDEPTWDELTYRVYWLLEGRDLDLGDVCARTVSRGARQVLAWCDPEEQSFTYITPSMAEAWGVEIAQVVERADANQCRLLADKTLEVEQVEGCDIGMIPIATGLKAAAILASNLKAFVGDKLRWPLYAVAPCRDFVLLFSQQDKQLLDVVGTVVAREFEASPYPICQEVFAIGDDGIRAVGSFERNA